MPQIIKFLLITVLLTIVSSDCPVQYYPGQTIIGFINAQINGDPQKQNNQQIYSYTMKQALSTSSPDVVVGVNAIDYQFTDQLSYRAVYQPTPKFGMLNFNVFVEDKLLKWKRLQFNFIATSHTQISAGYVQFDSFNNDKPKTKQNLVAAIKINDFMKSKPIIQTYINGVTLRSKMSRPQQQKILKQIQTFKRSPYSWNKAQSTILTKLLTSQSLLSYSITSQSLSNNSLSITLQLSDTIIISSLTVSYIIFNQMQFPLKNNLVHYQALALTLDKPNYQFNPLTNIDMTFIGLTGLGLTINQHIEIQFLVAKNKGLLNILSVKKLLENSMLYVSFFQTQTKFENQCENCPDSIFRLQTYCLSTCPRGYAAVKNGTNSHCSYCNISSFLIPNSDGNQCACATQYFYNTQFSKCESCHYSCFTCKDSTTCITCDSNDKTTKRFFNQTSKLCACMDGYFDNKNLVCEKCHPTCQTCTGSSIYQCKTCKQGRSLDSTNKCVCGPNFTDQNNQCICKQPNTLLNNVCYSKNLLSNSSCNKPNMIQSTINGQKVCTCDKGFDMYNNECISCPKTFILNKQTGKCECTKTAYLNTNTNQCIQCESMKFYDQRLQKCLCKKQYFEKQDGSCIDCPQKSVYKNGQCICVFNYYLKNNACIKCKKTSDDPNCHRVDVSEQ